MVINRYDVQDSSMMGVDGRGWLRRQALVPKGDTQKVCCADCAWCVLGRRQVLVPKGDTYKVCSADCAWCVLGGCRKGSRKRRPALGRRWAEEGQRESCRMIG